MDEFLSIYKGTHIQLKVQGSHSLQKKYINTCQNNWYKDKQKYNNDKKKVIHKVSQWLHTKDTI